MTKQHQKRKKSIKKSKSLFIKGKQYFIRTVTYHAVGICYEIIDNFIILNDALWVADSGRFSNALQDGVEKQPNSELEPIVGKIHININSIVDFVEYNPKIIVIQK